MTFAYYAKNKTYSEVNFIGVHQVWSKLIEKCLLKIQDGSRGDFPRIIVIALFLLFLSFKLLFFYRYLESEIVCVVKSEPLVGQDT